MEEMEAPPAPRSQSWIPSPVKRQLPTLTPQTYRAANLRAAKIFVEDLNELPSAIDDAVRQIVPISAWTGSTVALEEHLVTAAAWYQAESHRNTRKVSLERHWTCSLYSVVKTLVYPLNSDLRTSVEGKVWSNRLKPTASLPDKDRGEDTGETHTPSSAQRAPPSFSPGIAEVSAASSIMSSTASTTSTRAAHHFHIARPKPDVIVGLAEGAFISQHWWRLVELQASETIVSDPHVSEQDLRFPFLIAVVKGLSAHGSPVIAQNQAAVAGASMLNILYDLSQYADENTGSATDLQTSKLQTIPPLCFSVVTTGPTHEVFVHFVHKGAYHMHCIRSCRTTDKRDAQEFVHFLSLIIQWGKSAFKDSIVEKLNRMPAHECVRFVE